MSNVRTSYCPSLTGRMQIANARIALCNALFAKHHQGDFILRLDDTQDIPLKKDYEKTLLDDLQWMSIHWNDTPVYLSSRKTLYTKYIDQLLSAGDAYECFCSEAQLKMMYKTQRLQGKAPGYTGHCRRLTAAEQNEKRALGIKPTVRFKVPKGKTVKYIDLIRGVKKICTSALHDFVIRQADKVEVAFFCHAIDDAQFGVTHIFRGEKHIATVPKQILILEALGFNAPQYGHLSMMMGDDGAQLSKRNGSRSIAELRAHGFLPQAVKNYLARIGSDYDSQQIFSNKQLAQQFNAANLTDGPVRYNEYQLYQWQKQAILNVEPDDLWQWMGDDTHHYVPSSCQASFVDCVRSNVNLPDEATHLAKIIFSSGIAYDERSAMYLNEVEQDYINSVLEAMDYFHLETDEVINALHEKFDKDGADLYFPIRIALTGETHGPELKSLIQLMGIEEVKVRLRAALAYCK